MSATITVFDSGSAAYECAFATFLAHTDQKVQARRWLDEFVATLPSRMLLVDAGAGAGDAVSSIIAAFGRALLIEPNPFLRPLLAERCPQGEILPHGILEASVPPASADFVLCSHVLYYIPQRDWLAHVRRMIAWLSPSGVLAVILQNPGTDCMRMVRQFHGRSFDLHELAGRLEAETDARCRISLTAIDSRIETDEFTTACAIAEFMLNLLPMSNPPLHEALEAWVREHFATPDGRWRMSCTQDVLLVRRADANVE